MKHSLISSAHRGAAPLTQESLRPELSRRTNNSGRLVPRADYVHETAICCFKVCKLLRMCGGNMGEVPT